MEAKEARERYALLNVIEKKAKEEKDKLRGEVEADMIASMDTDDVRQKGVRIGDVDLGRISVTPASAKLEIDPARESEGLAFLTQLDLTEIKPVAGWRDELKKDRDYAVCETADGEVFMNLQTGEPVEGITVQYGRPTVKVTLNKLSEILPEVPSEKVAGLLQGASYE